MLTCKQINKVIQQKYPNLELVRGDGYFYLLGTIGDTVNHDVANWPEGSIYVCRLNHMTMEQWIDTIYGMINDQLKFIQKYGSI